LEESQSNQGIIPMASGSRPATSATFDEDGYLKITGRKKEIIVTASGKNVSPAFLEDPIRSDPLIGQVVVVGDAKPFISALVTLDPEMLPMWLSNNKLDSGMSLVDAASNPQVIAGVQAAIDRANDRVSRAESIRKFTILPIEFTEKSWSPHAQNEHPT
jgi:long-chain acyl-CoA synthetase